MNKKKRFGFTLIELIVVITIIAVLTAIGVVSYSGVTRKSRDSRRMADLEKYRIALEMARQVGSTYPADLTTLKTMGLIPDILADPKTGFNYDYEPAVAPAYAYSLYAQMEDPGSESSGAPFGFDCGGVNTCNYKVTSP
jgi:prepilin-type N-terminal cleavage/methylation domain-containing protein